MSKNKLSAEKILELKWNELVSAEYDVIDAVKTIIKFGGFSYHKKDVFGFIDLNSADFKHTFNTVKLGFGFLESLFDKKFRPNKKEEKHLKDLYLKIDKSRIQMLKDCNSISRSSKLFYLAKTYETDLAVNKHMINKNKKALQQIDGMTKYANLDSCVVDGRTYADYKQHNKLLMEKQKSLVNENTDRAQASKKIKLANKLLDQIDQNTSNFIKKKDNRYNEIYKY